MKYSKVFIIPLLMVCWAGALARPDKHDKKAAGPQIERVVAVDPNVSISVCVSSGDIKVHGWDRNQVRARTSDASEIEFRRSGPTGPTGSRDSESAKEIVVVPSNRDRHRSDSCMADADIELDVPRGAIVKVQIREGDIQMTGVSVVQAKTMNGDISLEGIKRAVEADVLSGNVSLRNSVGSARLHSVGGNIEALGVGPSAAGDTLDAATVGGDVTIDQSSYLKVEAGTVGGDLNISGPLVPGGRYEFQTISGDIHLSLPANSSFRLDARLSQNAELTTDFSLKIITGREQSPDTPPKPPAIPGRRHGTPGVPDPPKTPVYGLQHISAIYGTGDALLTVSSFSGGVYLQKK